MGTVRRMKMRKGRMRKTKVLGKKEEEKEEQSEKVRELEKVRGSRRGGEGGK